jgi:hypothetical protein
MVVMVPNTPPVRASGKFRLANDRNHVLVEKGNGLANAETPVRHSSTPLKSKNYSLELASSYLPGLVHKYVRVLVGAECDCRTHDAWRVHFFTTDRFLDEIRDITLTPQKIGRGSHTMVAQSVSKSGINPDSHPKCSANGHFKVTLVRPDSPARAKRCRVA